MSKVDLYAEIQVSIPFSKIDWQTINGAMPRHGFAFLREKAHARLRPKNEGCVSAHATFIRTYRRAVKNYAATPIASAFFKSASAILMLAMSMRRPSSDTAPFPALAASAMAVTMRRALVTSASDGVNT